MGENELNHEGFEPEAFTLTPHPRGPKFQESDYLGKSVKATEEVVGLGRYGKTLRVLTCHLLANFVEEEEEGGDDESLIERWIGPFRR